MNELVFTKAEIKTLSVVGPDTQALVDKVSADLQIADMIVIDSPEMLDEAQQIAGRLASVSAAIEAERKERVGPVNDVVKWLNAGYGAAREYIDAKVAGIKPKIVSYNQELRRQAEERADEERRKREAEAEAAAKREAEAMAEAARLVQQAQEAQQAGSEIVSEGLVNQAQSVADTARQEAQAAVVRAQTVSVTPVLKAKGIKGKWSGVVTDKAKLIRHIGWLISEGDSSLIGLLDVNESALNALAKAQQENLKLPGVVPNFSESVSVRKVAA